MQEKSRVNVAIVLSFVLVMIAMIIWAVQNGNISIKADTTSGSPVFQLTRSYCEGGMQVNEFSWTNSSFTPYILFARDETKGTAIDEVHTTGNTAKWADKTTCHNGVEKCYQSNNTLYFDLIAGNTSTQNSYIWGSCTGTSCVPTCIVCPISHNGIAVPKIDCSQSSTPTPILTSSPTASPSGTSKPCFNEGESLGAVIPDNADNKCCAGLVAVIPNGVIGTMGTCQKSTLNSTTQSVVSGSSATSSTSKPNVISLVSTGKSLWFNLAIALVAAAIISYLLLRRRRDY